MNPRADAVGTVFETYVQANKDPFIPCQGALWLLTEWNSWFFSHMQSESFFGFPLPRRETWCLSHIPPWNRSLIMMPLRSLTQKPVRKFRRRSMGRLCAFIAWCRGKEWSPRDQFCFNWNTFSCYHHFHNLKLLIVKKKTVIRWKLKKLRSMQCTLCDVGACYGALFFSIFI